MQKILLAHCLVCFALTLSAQKTTSSITTKRTSTKSSDHNNAIKLGVNTFFDTDEFPFNVSWETKVGPSESIQIGMLPRISRYNDDKTSGLGLSVAYRKYISKNRTGIQGLFVSPVVKVGYLSENYSYKSYYYTGNPPQLQFYTNNRQSKTSQFNVGVVFGHKWAYRSGFTFEASGGLGYYNTIQKYNSTNTGAAPTLNDKYTYSGILPQLQINFGYAF